jgi:hypothetical protein
MLKTACTTIALLAVSNPASASGCATPADASALKIAVMQQELMVAAFQCREADAYNRFVMTYRGELQSSDAVLKSFFVRRGGEHGEAGYDTFKTKAANLSALEQARHGNAFCTDAHALFTAALNNPGSLMRFVESRYGATDVGNICAESRPVLASADARRENTPGLGTVKIATAGPAEVAVGVPAHSLPAIPYRRADVAAVPTAARNDDLDDAEASYPDAENSPSPRYDQTRSRDYGDSGYAPRPYGPPRRDATRYGWYPRDHY